MILILVFLRSMGYVSYHGNRKKNIKIEVVVFLEIHNQSVLYLNSENIKLKVYVPQKWARAFRMCSTSRVATFSSKIRNVCSRITIPMFVYIIL